MSYSFYTTEKNEEKLKSHILAQIKAAQAAAPKPKQETGMLASLNQFKDEKGSEFILNRLAGNITNAIIEVQQGDFSKDPDPAKSFALAVRVELGANNPTLGLIAKNISNDDPKKGPIVTITPQDLLTNITGVDENRNVRKFTIQNKTLPTLYDELKVGAPTVQAAAPTPATQQPPAANPATAATTVKTSTRQQPASTTKPAPPAAVTPSSSATMGTSPSSPQSDFEKKYKQLSEMISLSIESIETGIKSKKNKDVILNDAVEPLKLVLVDALKPALQAKGVKFDDKDLQAVAEITSKTIIENVYGRKQAAPNEPKRNLPSVQEQADVLGGLVREALNKASKEGRLGKLGGEAYLDALSGVDENGKLSASNKDGLNFHTLGATVLVQALGTPAAQEEHKKNVARADAKSNFQAQGGTLSTSSIDQTVDASATGFSDATKAKVKEITRNQFAQSASWDDTMKAWDKQADKDKKDGKEDSFFNMIKRFLMMVDALIESFTGFSIMNSIMGPGSNPIITEAKEQANKRHIEGTHAAILAETPAALGVENEAKRKELADKVKAGLTNVTQGLDAQGTAQGMVVAQPTEEQRRAAEEAERVRLAQEQARNPSAVPRPPSEPLATRPPGSPPGRGAVPLAR